MPVGLLRAYVTMLPRLRAEESLLAMERTATGMVSIEPEARRNILRTWERQTERHEIVVLTDTPKKPVRRVRMTGDVAHAPIRKVVVTRD